MKRSPPTFVVEVRRQRRSTNSGGKAWLAEPTLPGAASRSGRLSGAAAPFEGDPKAPPAAETPPSRPQGRILPSLADIAPIASPFEEPAAPPRRRRESIAPTAKPKTRTKKDSGGEFAPPRRSASAAFDPTGATPSLRSFETASVDVRAVASPAGGGMAADAERKARTRSPGAKSKREIETARALAGALAARAALDAEPAAVPDASLESAATDRAGARQARHRRILDRYVLGVELRPGQRWKRRSQEGRK
jgi:hypothetical protein